MPTDSPVWNRELLYWTWVLAVTGVSWLLSPSQVTHTGFSLLHQPVPRAGKSLSLEVQPEAGVPCVLGAVLRTGTLLKHSPCFVLNQPVPYRTAWEWGSSCL